MVLMGRELIRFPCGRFNLFLFLNCSRQHKHTTRRSLRASMAVHSLAREGAMAAAREERRVSRLRCNRFAIRRKETLRQLRSWLNIMTCGNENDKSVGKSN